MLSQSGQDPAIFPVRDYTLSPARSIFPKIIILVFCLVFNKSFIDQACSVKITDVGLALYACLETETDPRLKKNHAKYTKITREVYRLLWHPASRYKVIHLLCSQGSSPQRGKDTISPVIGRNVKSTKHLRCSDSLVKPNSKTVLLLKIIQSH